MSMTIPLPRRRVFSPRLPILTRIGLAILGAALVVVALGPLILTHDPYQFSFTINEPPSAAHWLGTDKQGQDIYSRLVVGTRLSLAYGASAALIALGLGGIAALAALALGRIAETLVFGVNDLIRALPGILFALVFIVAFEPGALSVIMALGISFAPNFALITRATYQQQMARPYTKAAFTFGASRLRLALVHVLPNIAGALVTQFAIVLPRCIVSESVLSFLGLGVSPETPTWGRMIAEATGYTEEAPHAVLAPILVLALVTFALAMVGDALRDRFDPTRRRMTL